MKTIRYLVALIAVAVILVRGYQKYVADEPATPEAGSVAASDSAPRADSAPALTGVPADVQAHIDAHADLIQVTSPTPTAAIRSPLTVTGEARGAWFFEGDFPVVLVDWDGRIIADGVATADGEWMTEDFVPFRATLEFETPGYGERGALILQKDNASGLPEHDDALEIPIRFEPPKS